MQHNRPAPHSESTTLAAGVDQTITVKGPSHPGLRRVDYLFLSHDEGGGAVQDILATIVPQRATDRMGGNVAHSIFGQPAVASGARNTLALGFSLPAGEDVDVTLNSPGAGTIRWTLVRWLIFDETAPRPMLVGPGGAPMVVG